MNSKMNTRNTKVMNRFDVTSRLVAKLKHEEAAIHNQERTDKNINGGYITPGQQAHLNAEENSLNHQIKQDK